MNRLNLSAGRHRFRPAVLIAGLYYDLSEQENVTRSGCLKAPVPLFLYRGYILLLWGDVPAANR